MKKYLILTFLILAACQGWAQERRGSPVRFGVKAGMNSSSYKQTTRTVFSAPDMEGEFVNRGDIHDRVAGIAFHVEFHF